MAFRLPPLNTLRLFEAAARNVSFKIAAQELGVTRSAVSHGIQVLEGWLGVPLFARSSRGLLLTDAGRRYVAAVEHALRLITCATERVPGRGAGPTLSISVAPSFAHRILVPILSRFRPLTAFNLDTSTRTVEFPRDGFDLAIRMGRGYWEGLEAIKIVDEHLVPVCSPEFLRRMSPVPTLRTAPLIHVSTCSQDWEAWAKGAGLSPIEPRGLVLDAVPTAYEAAAQGLGVVIGRRPMIDDDLASGRLVVFCGPVVQSENSYWLVGPAASMKRPDVAAFREWLVSELRTMSETSRFIAGSPAMSA